MNKRLSRLFLPAVLCAFALALATAGGASAAADQIYVGEVSTAEHPAIENGEADPVKAMIEFDSTTGRLTGTVTTRSAPTENENLVLRVALVSGSKCSPPQGEAERKAFFPMYGIQAAYKQPEGQPDAFWTYEKQEGEPAGAEGAGLASKTVEGAATTVSATAKPAVGGGFTCAFAGVLGESTPEVLLIPLTRKPEPILPPAPAPPAPTPPAPKPALSLLKANPLKLKTEKWTTVTFKVSNPGTAAIGPVTVKATPPKGVTVKTRSVRLPALLAGQTWPVSFKVKVTKAAKAKSLLKLAATATGLSASGTVTIKPTG
jgi:hypothetical protein